MTFSTEIADGKDLWVLSFKLIFGKRSHKCLVEAVNKRNKHRLRMPEDREKLVALLPWDMWPPFATEKYPSSNITHEGLF